MFQPGLFKGKRIPVTGGGTGQTIALDGAGWQANGGSFTEMLSWGDSEWEQARALIKAQNEKDKAQRSV
jgi:hypothetical protein